MKLPNELPDIGSTAQRLRQNPGFDPIASGIGPEEYFVWTRFDGATTLKDLILMTGLDSARAVEIVRRLASIGAILVPGRSAAPSDDNRPTTKMEEQVDIPAAERARIVAMHDRVYAAGGNPLTILGVSNPDDKKAIKRAYFALSKEFHPDVYFGKRTGSYGARLDAIFEAMTRAYESLGDDRPRRAKTPSPTAAQHPADHAAEIYERACQAEIGGDLASALTLFAAALRIDALAKYYRRATRCAINAGETVTALEYAKKAANLEPNDLSTARVLASAFKASGNLEHAEETLVLALMIKSENDQLGHELRADLAEIRRLSLAKGAQLIGE